MKKQVLNINLTSPSFFSAPDVNKELDPNVLPTTIDPSQLNGSLSKEKDDTDTNCWTSPSGLGFMIRGKNYLKDNSKVDFSSHLLIIRLTSLIYWEVVVSPFPILFNID